MPRLKAVLLDLDGVVYVAGRPLPGSLAAVDRLHAAGLAVRYLTNTTRTPRRVLLARLRDMGLKLRDSDLVTPAAAARQWIERRGLRPHLLVHPALEEEFAGLGGQGRQAVVVGDAGAGFTYDAMNAAFRALDAGAEFIALANNRCFRDSDGGLSLDAGPFVAALSYAARKEALVVGKPAAALFRSALDSAGCEPAAAAMIGDDVEADVAGAMAVGMTGILVRTGKYQEGVEAHITPRPHLVVDDLAAAVDRLLQPDREAAAPSCGGSGPE